MQTVKEVFAQFKTNDILRSALPPVIIVVLTVLLEIFVFNLPSIETATLGSGTIFEASSVTPVEEEVEATDGTKVINKEVSEYEIEFTHIDMKVISIHFAGLTEKVEGAVGFKDEGSRYYYTASEELILNPDDPRSFYTIVGSAGDISSILLRMECSAYEAELLGTIIVNKAIPFDIDFARMAVIIIGAALLWYGRPRSRLFARAYVPNFKKSCIMFGCTAAVMVVFYVIYTMVYVEAVGDFDAEANNSYFELAQALASGSLSLLVEPSSTLQHLMNPYAPLDRFYADAPYLWDHAYYQGNYYVYFGILPVLVFHLPYYLITGGSFPNHIAIFITMLSMGAGVIYLLNNIIRAWFPEMSWGAFLSALLILFSGGWMVFFFKSVNIYSLPICMGLMCVVWALAFWVRSVVGTKIDLVFASAGSLFAGLTLASRPQLFVVSILGLIFFVKALREGKGRGPLTVVVFAPLFVVAVLVGLYNFLRFGSFLDFGANYNLTTNDMTRREWTLDKVPQALFYYLFSPLELSNMKPYVLTEAPASWFLGLTIFEPLQGGLISAAPVILTGLFLVGNKYLDGFYKGFALACIGCGLILVVFDGESAGILPRYFCDFGFFFTLPAVITQLFYGSSVLKMHEVAKIEGAEQPSIYGLPPRGEGYRVIQMVLTVAMVFTVVFQLTYVESYVISLPTDNH